LRPGFLEERRVGVIPDGEQALVGGLGFGFVSRQTPGCAEFKAG